MYESPIKLYVQDMTTQLIQKQEQAIFEAVNRYDVDVDKEELIKALKYDRDQYNEGYKDGVNEVLDKIKAEILKYKPGDPNAMCPIEYHRGALGMQLRVLEIIDRYKESDNK